MAALAVRVQMCRRCPLGQNRTVAVPGEGPVPCDVMLVGEGPGAAEDKTGRPFVGRAGQLLRRLLREEARLDPEAVYITNVVKCRSCVQKDGKTVDTPPPLSCVEACSTWLRHQIELVQPKAIIVIGAVACKYLLNMPIGEAHGMAVRLHGQDICYLPVYHPAAALRDPARMRDFVYGMKGIGLWLDLNPDVRRYAHHYTAREVKRA
ncbi:MAG: uracil-DNA glycosylase [Armatimonadota bacterium]|nr:uracil-DNA glycosylase [Armatimonadota bacterium]